MRRPVDDAVRERALDPAASFIVQAPAGSGKTELLIRRFLVLLARVEQPEEVVAITFTRKAAAEMRERVLGALALAQQAGPQAELERELWHIAQAAWRNNQDRGWQLQHHPSRLRIQTIDALCAALTRQMPWLSRFGAPMSVVEDAVELYREAALRTVQLLAGRNQRWAAAVADLLGHLDNRVSRAVDLLTDMLRHRDQWLRHVGPGTSIEDQSWRHLLEAAWTVVIRTELARVRALIPDRIEQDVCACAHYAASHFAAMQAESPIRAWRDGSHLPGNDIQDLSAWRGLAALLLRTDNRWRSSVNKAIGFPARKDPQADAMRRRMLDLLKALAPEEALRNALMRVRRLPAPGYDDDQWRILAALLRLLPLAAAQLNILFAERGQVDFSEITVRANRALGDLEAPSELALRLDYQIRHLLVDEFQDTSLTQYELLERLTAGWEPADGRTLFLVGDPMQSIYRFREAEVGLFLEVAEHGLQSITPERLVLSVNFRSDPAIVGWTNSSFRDAFPNTPDSRRGAVAFARSDRFLDPVPDAGVSVHALIDADRSDEAQRVVEIVGLTCRSRPDGDIAILVRSRAQLREIIPALDAAGLDYVGVEIGRLVHQPVVQDLLSLTQGLLHLADRSAWLAILRAPWCGLTLDDLHALMQDADDRCIWDQLQREDVRTRLSEDGQAQIDRFVEVLRKSIAGRGRYDLRAWVARAWEQLGGPVCGSEKDLRNAEAFLALVAEHADGGELLDSQALLRAVHDTWTRSSAESGVQLKVMTLHKAKGLEFDTVIIPGLERLPRRAGPRLLLWEEDASQPEHSLLLAPLSPGNSRRDAHYDYLQRLRGDKDAFEIARLLYVGCTRARRHLHLLGTVSSRDDGSLRPPPSNSFLGQIWGAVRGDFGKAHAGQLALFQAHDGPFLPRTLQRLPVDWRPPVPQTLSIISPPESAGDRDTIEFSWAGETARQVGILVHEFLQRFADGVAEWDRERLNKYRGWWRDLLIARGIPQPELDVAVERVHHALVNVIADPRAHWLFEPRHRDRHSEHALSGVVDGVVRHVRIDRTFIDQGDVRWIIDFKSSAHEGGGLDAFLDRELQRYRPQLDGYARILRCMEQRPVRLGLYFPLIKGWREWSHVAE